MREGPIYVALALVGLTVAGCRPAPSPPQRPAESGDLPAPAVRFRGDPPPPALFSEDGSALTTPEDPRCADLGVRCSAPYVRLARTLGSPRASCAADILALEKHSAADRAATGGEGLYSRGETWAEWQLAESVRRELDLKRLPPAPTLTAYGPASPSRIPGGSRTTWVLDDPVIGAQRLLLHTPETPGPHPGVLALPGHQESPEEFMELHGGNAMVNAGYAVLLPVFKAYDGDTTEDEAARALFCVGSSLMAVRVREAANALRLLRALRGIAPGPVGLVGHSGGCMVGNLLVRLEDAVGAYVTDMTGVYLSIGDRIGGPPLLMDETHLGLRSISRRIARFGGDTPVLEVPYGAPNGGVQLVPFLDHALRGAAQPPPPAVPEPLGPDGDPMPDDGPPGGDVEDLGDVAPRDDRPFPRPGGTLSRSIELWGLDSSEVRTCRDLAAADLDGDGKDELALATDDEPDEVWEVRDGVLKRRWVGPSKTIARGVAWGDGDGDGDQDLVFAVNNGAARLFRNDGGQLTPSWSGREERLGKGIAWADLDGDGDLDLAIGDTAYSEFVRNDAGTLVSWEVSALDRRHEDAVAVDIDGDGRQEVAFAVSEPGPPPFEVWRYDGQRFAAVPLDIEPGPRASALAFADVDGDGQIDVALARPGDHDTVMLQDRGVFRVAWTSEAAVQTRVVTFWDADRDGDPDLVLGEDGPLALYENRGGTFKLAWRSAEADDTEGLTTADIDGDGHKELVTCAQKGAPLRVYRTVPR